MNRIPADSDYRQTIPFTMKWLLTGLVLFVVIVHQDTWLWTDKTLVFGFLPIGLVYHLGYCLLASATMAVLVKVAWPKELETVEALPASDAAGGESRS